jgi:hypothetical protein
LITNVPSLDTSIIREAVIVNYLAVENMVLPKYARIKSPFILITELYSLDFIVSF